MKNYNFDALINGEMVTGKKKIEIISPLNNDVVGEVSSLSHEEIDLAFDAAKKAFNNWKITTIDKRIKLMKYFSEKLIENKNDLAEIMHLEVGKSTNDALVEVERTNEYILKTIEVYNNIHTKKMTIGKKENTMMRIPLGVVLAISPFNYPVNLSLAKIVPALLAGNTIVFKSATNGSLTGGFLAKLFNDIDLPNGVFNFVSGKGREIGDSLIENKNIDMITFTGSVRIGKQIASKKQMIPLVLELGGNDAAYVRGDIEDLEKVVKMIIGGAFSYSGQRCTAIKRLILDKSIKDTFLKKLKEETIKMKLPPVIDLNSAKYIKQLIDTSKKNHDEFILDGDIKGNKIPAHIVITTKDSSIWREEAFGPVLPIIIVDNDNDAITLINDTNFGLQNSIFTKDVEWAKSISPIIESGTVNINAASSRGPDIFPFLGVKDSGFGVQGIEQALLSMTRHINIIDNK